MNIVIILSGGAGSRFGAGVPKQYLDMRGRPVIVHTMETFERCEAVDHVLVVTEKSWERPLIGWAEQYGLGKLWGFAPAGADRQQSILNGLQAARRLCTGAADGVIIQDAVRPLTSVALIGRLLAELKEAPAVLPVLPVTDTVYHSEDGRRVDGLPDRSTLYAGQAPEAFRYREYMDLYESTPPEKRSAMSGSCQLPFDAGWPVKMIPGERENIKLTFPADWELCELIMKAREGQA